MEADLGAAWLPLFFFRHVRIALRQRDELRGRELVHPGGNALDHEGQRASHRHDSAGTLRAVPRRRADRSNRPALPGSLARSGARLFRPGHGVRRVAGPSAALAPLRHDARHRRWLRDVLGHGKRTGAGGYSHEPIHRSKCGGAGRCTERDAYCGRFRRLPLQHGGNRGNSGDRWYNLFRLGVLSLSGAPRIRLAAGESEISAGV